MDLLKASSPSCPSAGSRDKTGRAVVEVHGDRMGWTSPLVSAQSLCELLLYLHSIPRYSAERLRCISREKKDNISIVNKPVRMEFLLCNMWEADARRGKYLLAFHLTPVIIMLWKGSTTRGQQHIIFNISSGQKEAVNNIMHDLISTPTVLLWVISLYSYSSTTNTAQIWPLHIAP